MGETDPRNQLIAVGERLAAAGLVRESEGNLSIRLGDSHCVVTSTGSNLGRLDAANLLEVPIETSAIPAGASSEAQLHLELYRIRPDVNAIVHAHPPRLLRLDAEGKLPVWRRLEDRGKMLGSVVAVPYHAEGTLALARATAGALRTARACVLRKHGAVTVGPSLMAAFVGMLDLERAASLTGTRS
jgi:L-fuculose-phosphate aldolase